jgi:hypothetical protein
VVDLSVWNPNVYYELGIRDGVCARGVFIIEGGWPMPKPFDVAPDRSFKYDGKLFLLGDPGAKPSEKNDKEIKNAAKHLAAILARAIQSDAQGTGSTLYAHLPGLRPVNWDAIEISRARYFGTLQRDWEARVRKAREMDRPGHIITLAQDAPTRLHRTKILSEAAHALIGLCQFHTAEDVLQEILKISPDDIDSQLNLGIVLAMCHETERAEHQLRSMLHRHEANPKAGAALGDVYRLLWYLRWKKDDNPRERARESSELLKSSICNFLAVHRLHAEEYFCGYEALLLMAVTAEVFPDLQLPLPLVDRDELTTVVRYVASAAREKAEQTGDYETQFTSALALSGLEMLKNNDKDAIQRIEDACSVPSATRFFLQLLNERLELLRLLKFKETFVINAKKKVEDALNSKGQQKKWANVVVFHGYPMNEPEGEITRFPASAEKPVATRSASLVDNPEIEVWYHKTELGDPVETASAQGRHNRWILNTARMEAENSEEETRLYGLILWDSDLSSIEGTDPEDSSFFISEIRASKRFKGHVLTINPCLVGQTQQP